MEDSFLSVEHIFKAMIEEMPIFKRLGISLEKYMEVLMNIRGNRKVDNQNPEATYSFQPASSRSCFARSTL